MKTDAPQQRVQHKPKAMAVTVSRTRRSAHFETSLDSQGSWKWQTLLRIVSGCRQPSRSKYGAPRQAQPNGHIWDVSCSRQTAGFACPAFDLRANPESTPAVTHVD